MSDPSHLRVKALFDRALDLPADERPAFLERECGGDAALRQRVEGLLRAAEGDTGFFAAPTNGGTLVPESPESATLHEGPGSRIGPYRLLELIGEGGFGSVYLAEQEQPVRRKVALKIIKLGMDTRQVVARFEQERQALALMEHPNIAKVLDAGATATGRPYFVMELVRGVPITVFCDRNKLSPRERLELFVPVCHAVQHAHQKGVIHRDIKPSNILVTLHDGVPVPKVIDFGIAKATNARLTERTLFTEHRQIVGTPAYMSPEQAELSGLDIDTRSDIYSLGVLLYEMLTGTTPLSQRELLEAGYAELQRVIREVDPPKPSTRVSTLGENASAIAAMRRTEPSKLGALMRGDLDWIVMKALEKDRRRRYESATGLAADVLRHLGGEPVEAAPPSALYRLRKLVRRRRGLFIALSAVGAVFLLGLTGTVVGLLRASAAAIAERDAREEEARQRSHAEASVGFLHDMFSSIDPERSNGRELTVGELIDDAAARLGGALANDPVAEATLRQTLGETYNQLGRYGDAKEQFLRAAELRARTLGPTHRMTLAARFGIGATAIQKGELDEGLLILEQTLEAQRKALGANDADTIGTLSVIGYTHQLRGDNERALAIYREALPALVGTLGQGHKATLETMGSIADVLRDLGRLDEAERAAREHVAASLAAQGPDGPQTLSAKSILSAVLTDLSRFDEALPLAREVLALKRKRYGNDHLLTLITESSLASTLEHLKQHAEAIELLTHASDVAARTLGGEHDTTLAYLGNLARNQQLHGNLDVAEETFRKLLEVRRRVNGDAAIQTLTIMNNLGLLLLAREKPAEAEEIMRPMLAGIDQATPADHWMRGQARVNLARSLAGQSKFEEAEALILDGYGKLAAALPEGHERRVLAAGAIASLYERWGKADEAARWKSRR